jgi:hypothetical protein
MWFGAVDAQRRISIAPAIVAAGGWEAGAVLIQTVVKGKISLQAICEDHAELSDAR